MKVDIGVTDYRLSEIAVGTVRPSREEGILMAKMLLELKRQSPTAEIVSSNGDQKAFGEREVKPLVNIQHIPYNTKLYTAPPAFIMLPDDYYIMPKSLTGENEVKNALMGKFTVTYPAFCQECEDGYINERKCNFCCGSGAVDDQLYIDWMTIKSIYSAIVEHYAAT